MTWLINKLFDVLNSIKLTATEWLVVMLSVGISGLLVAFRLQGSKLHKTQIDLLQSQVNQTEEEDTQKEAKARSKFERAYKHYKNSGGK